MCIELRKLHTDNIFLMFTDIVASYMIVFMRMSMHDMYKPIYSPNEL